MTRDDNLKLPKTLWQTPDALGKVQDALKKYKGRHSPFWKQMLRYIPETYLERLFRQAWLNGYYLARKEAAREAANSSRQEVQ